MTMRPGKHDDELISASLTGDLSEDEQAALDRHLADCARCRETLAAFAEERRLISGMRHVAPPREMGARVRAGIESGATPWWRRPGLLVGIGASLATVTAAVLAVVVFGDLVRGPVASTGSPRTTGSAVASTVPTSNPPETPAAPTAEPTAPLPVAMKHPASWFKYRLASQRSTLELATAAEGTQVPVDDSGFPIEGSVSPNGLWMAFRLQGDGSGLVSTYAFSVSDGTLVPLGDRGTYSSFARFAWSPNGKLLAYTLLDEAGSADVWILNTAANQPKPARLTDTGRTFVGSFISESDLWVSSASEGDPASYQVQIPANGHIQEASDPASVATATYPGVFLPVDNREGQGAPNAVVYWRGQMAHDSTSWLFARGGMLYWHGSDESGTLNTFDAADPQVFDTLQVQPSGTAFESARFTWAPDSDGFAVWEAQWTGTPEGDGFPDENRVYFTHLAGGLKIGAPQALDLGDTQGASVVDVALGGDQYLGLTVVTEAGSEGGTFGPTAELRLVTRNTGNVPDEVETIGQNHVWNGPPLYPAVVAP